MDMTIKDFVDLFHGVGVSGALLLMLWLWGPRMGLWVGENVFIPIRDALIGNIALLTKMVTEVREVLPNVMLSTAQTQDMLRERKEQDNQNLKDGERNRAAWRTVLMAMSQRCPVVDACPFQQHKKSSDSDEFGNLTPPTESSTAITEEEP